MKQFFQKIKKIKNINNLSSLLVLLVAVIISISGIQIFKTEAADSYLGGASNNLLVQGGAIIATSPVPTGLVVQTGNVGIGTPASPNGKLHLYSTSGELVLRMQNAASGGRNWELNSKNSSGSFSIIDRTATADRLLINSSGNVGIGTTNPQYKLSVVGGSYGISGSGGVYGVKGDLGDGDTFGYLGYYGGLGSSAGVYGKGDPWGVYGSGYSYGIYGNATGPFGYGVYGSGSWYGVYSDSDLGAPNNHWGSCHWVTTTYSCSTSGWQLGCDDGEFMTGIENVGGSNSCIKKIYCCEL
jgi:hypothetical protein